MKLHKAKIPDIVLLPICLFRCEVISVYTIYSRRNWGNVLQAKL